MPRRFPFRHQLYLLLFLAFIMELTSCDNTAAVVTGTTTISTIATGTLVDSRDSHIYRTVRIGTQWWMAQSLNYDTLSGTGGRCYHDSAVYCEIYGRFYTWTAAMSLPDSFRARTWNSSLPRKGICPEGWHIPSDSEWHVLVNYVDSPTAAVVLKAKTLWMYAYWNSSLQHADSSTDEFGFSLFPSGWDWTPVLSPEAVLWCETPSTKYSARTRVTYDWDDSIRSATLGKSDYATLRCVRDP